MEAHAEAFLAELTELTRKYQIVIWTCGCCSSPRLEPLDEGKSEGRYVGSCDEWTHGYADEVHWEEETTCQTSA